jgi:hypothetical protein
MIRPAREPGTRFFLPPHCGEVRHAFGVLGWGKVHADRVVGRMRSTPPVARIALK